MDTSKLVVGQDAYMITNPDDKNGGYDKGKVTKITPFGVEVKVLTGLRQPRLRHFDRYGKGRDYEGEIEWGVWELTDDERIILDIEEGIARKEFAQKDSPPLSADERQKSAKSYVQSPVERTWAEIQRRKHEAEKR